MSTKRILISKTKNQDRVAILDGKILCDLEINLGGREQKIDNIYNGEIVSIAPSLEAAFVSFGTERNGFLPLREISSQYYKEGANGKNIQEAIFEGQKILVQVNKEERGNKKGAALSTYISLAGCYLVLMPNNSKANGISRRIVGEEREDLKNTLRQLKIPEKMGVIVRTAGIGKSVEQLQWDLDVLIKLWDNISQASDRLTAPYLIYSDNDMTIRAVRDHLRPDISEILVDEEKTYERICLFLEQIGRDTGQVKLYTDSTPLFSRFQIEHQIEQAFQRTVKLPAGGEVAIDRTEALIAIDVNSAQSTKGEDIEETALNTNLEAVKEIARQLRIRDLGGLFVIDFIDMENKAHNRQVEDYLREALKEDRARIKQKSISCFGLLEMSRQRLKPALSEAVLTICPRCHGQGSIRNIQAQASSLVGLIEENALTEKIGLIRVQVPTDVATYLLNEHRTTIRNIEDRHNIIITVIPNPYFENPQYEITCANRKQTKTNKPSYEQVKTPKVAYDGDSEKSSKFRKMKPAVENSGPTSPAPQKKARKPWFITRLIKFLFGEKTVKKDENHINTRRYPRNNNSNNYRRNKYQSNKSSTQRRPGPGTRNIRRSSINNSRRKPTSRRPNQIEQYNNNIEPQKNSNEFNNDKMVVSKIENSKPKDITENNKPDTIKTQKYVSNYVEPDPNLFQIETQNKTNTLINEIKTEKTENKEQKQ